MKHYELRPAVPPNGSRTFVLFGGPDDGKIVQQEKPPLGYADTGGMLCIWWRLNTESLWSNK